MRKLNYILIVVLIFSVFSCAIHRKFPFICFKKECVLGQMGFYAARDGFRRAKINTKVRKHKRMIKKNIKAGRKGKKPPYDTNLEKKQSDSLAYTGGFAGVCKNVNIIFEEMPKAIQSETPPVWHKDTVVAHYTFEDRDLSEKDKKIIKELVEKRGPGYFGEIRIINCHRKSVLSDFEILMLTEREKRIIKYLKKLGISENRVVIED
jgi:hypothetical protein